MKKFIREYKDGCPRIEIITIEEDNMTQEFLWIDNKAVWKIWKVNLLSELHWKKVNDYIKHIKELSFKELTSYKDNLVWINPNTNKEHKQYQL